MRNAEGAGGIERINRMEKKKIKKKNFKGRKRKLGLG